MKIYKIAGCKKGCLFKAVNGSVCLHPKWDVGGKPIPPFRTTMVPGAPLKHIGAYPSWCPLDDLPNLDEFNVTCKVVDTEIKLFGRPKYSDRVKGAVERIISAGCVIRIGMLA